MAASLEIIASHYLGIDRTADNLVITPRIGSTPEWQGARMPLKHAGDRYVVAATRESLKVECDADATLTVGPTCVARPPRPRRRGRQCHSAET